MRSHAPAGGCPGELFCAASCCSTCAHARDSFAPDGSTHAPCFSSLSGEKKTKQKLQKQFQKSSIVLFFCHTARLPTTHQPQHEHPPPGCPASQWVQHWPGMAQAIAGASPTGAAKPQSTTNARAKTITRRIFSFPAPALAGRSCVFAGILSFSLSVVKGVGSPYQRGEGDRCQAQETCRKGNKRLPLSQRRRRFSKSARVCEGGPAFSRVIPLQLPALARRYSRLLRRPTAGLA